MPICHFKYQHIYSYSGRIIGSEVLIDFNKTIGTADLILTGKVLFLLYKELVLNINKIPDTLFVNVERHNLCDLSIRECLLKINALLISKGKKIIIEVTERNECSYCPYINHEFSKINDWDIELAIDDVCGVYDSRLITNESIYFSYAKIEMPIKLSKRSLVSFKNLVEMSKLKNKKIIIERVETEEQYHLLKSINVYGVQGFLFDKGYFNCITINQTKTK